MMDGTWHIQDEERFPGIRIRVKRLTVGDGIKKSALELDMAERTTEESAPMMLAATGWFPLLTYATDVVEGLPFPFTLEQFLEFDEALVKEWVDCCIEFNPSHQLTVADLKNLLSALEMQEIEKFLDANSPGAPTSEPTSVADSSPTTLT